MPTIEMLGDQQQVQHWTDLTYQAKVVGAYAQTEVGHGSDVKSLETEAVFDEQRKGWVLNSPGVTSAKFWVGLLGNFCTHVVLQARAVVRGQYLGIQTFVVEIRNE
jgi:acyl-CoA oxidase